MHRPKLLILDEATSALDPQSEAAICETLQQLRGKLTILTISHQPALVELADKTYRIEPGKIFELENDHGKSQIVEVADLQPLPARQRASKSGKSS